MTGDLHLLKDLAHRVAGGTLVPYLGPGVLDLTPDGAPVPSSPGALCQAIEARVTVPRRARGNLWSAAHYVETRRFRRTLEALVADAFAGQPRGNPIHDWLARVLPPLVVDVWYDDGLLAAYANAPDWGLVRGVTRNGQWRDIWTRTYDAGGGEVDVAAAESWRSLIYKPHGCVRPGGGVLLSDADYVEVLTEIDIQTPIPAAVQHRRKGRGFLFLGCRFDDQLLRTFARQIIKRSAGPHYAVLTGDLTRMERRFFEEQQITLIPEPLDTAIPTLVDA